MNQAEILQNSCQKKEALICVCVSDRPIVRRWGLTRIAVILSNTIAMAWGPRGSRLSSTRRHAARGSCPRTGQVHPHADRSCERCPHVRNAVIGTNTRDMSGFWILIILICIIELDCPVQVLQTSEQTTRSSWSIMSACWRLATPPHPKQHTHTHTCNHIKLVFYLWSENKSSRWKGETERRSLAELLLYQSSNFEWS